MCTLDLPANGIGHRRMDQRYTKWEDLSVSPAKAIQLSATTTDLLAAYVPDIWHIHSSNLKLFLYPL